MDDRDKVVKVGKNVHAGRGGGQVNHVIRGQKALNAAIRNGVKIETEKKDKQPDNRQQLAKLDGDGEDKVEIKTVPPEVSKAIAKKRNEMKLTQKALAIKANIPVDVVTDYETINTKRKPESKYTNPLRKALQIELTGKNLGQPLEQRKKKATNQKKDGAKGKESAKEKGGAKEEKSVEEKDSAEEKEHAEGENDTATKD